MMKELTVSKTALTVAAIGGVVCIASLVCERKALSQESEPVNRNDALATSGSVLYPARDGQLMGYVTSEGRWAIEPRFALAGEFVSGRALVVNWDPGFPWGQDCEVEYILIDLHGNQVSLPNVDSARIDPCRRILFGVNNEDAPDGCLYGFMDFDGNIIAPATYDRVQLFSEGLAAVCEEGKWGFIDTDGRVVIEPRFDAVGPFSEGVSCVAMRTAEAGEADPEYRCGVIDHRGEIVIPLRYPSLYGDVPGPCSEGLVAIAEDGRVGYMNLRGDWVLRPQYQVGYPFQDGVAFVMVAGDGRPGLTGIIDRRGEFVLSPRFENGGLWSDGLAPVLVDGAWGYVNSDGFWEIEPQFVMASSFSNGLARVVIESGPQEGRATEMSAAAHTSALIDRSGRLVWVDTNIDAEETPAQPQRLQAETQPRP